MTVDEIVARIKRTIARTGDCDDLRVLLLEESLYRARFREVLGVTGGVLARRAGKGPFVAATLLKLGRKWLTVRMEDGSNWRVPIDDAYARVLKQ